MSKNIARSLALFRHRWNIICVGEGGGQREQIHRGCAPGGEEGGNARVKYLTIRSMNFNRRQGIIAQLVRSLNIERFFSPPVASSFFCLFVGFFFSKKTMISRNLYFCREEEEEFIETIINLDNNTTFIYLHG